MFIASCPGKPGQSRPVGVTNRLHGGRVDHRAGLFGLVGMCGLLVTFLMLPQPWAGVKGKVRQDELCGELWHDGVAGSADGGYSVLAGGSGGCRNAAWINSHCL